MSDWTPSDSEELYNVPNWGGGYFRINARGNVEALPGGTADGQELAENPDPAIDLFQILKEIQGRGIKPPILLRLDGILRSRVRELYNAFAQASADFQYEGPYCAVFPIKVNQQRHVVESLLEEGRQHGMGLEVGSKPELLAVMALHARSGTIVVCNGYKDRAYVETALLCSKLGIEVILVIEKLSELGTIIEASELLGIEPRIGIRSKLSIRGSGRWMESAGQRSKFGLTTRQIVQAVETLTERGKLDWLQLLHFHVGSQITNVRSVKEAVREATRLLIELRQMGAPIRWFDVGGGLGVDYDGSSTDFESSMNYTLQEYANDIVFHLKEACVANDMVPPGIISESGRALTAHHAVLITEVLGVSDFSTVGIPSKAEPDEHELIRNFAGVCEAVDSDNFQECFHDALQHREEAMTFFNVGQLSLAERARIEEFYWRTCEKILRITRKLEYVPDDLSNLEREMADTYFLNFSLFQSVPDSWAIGQMFPVLPLHRHEEKPLRRAVLADITCDSDGKVDRFIDLRDIKDTLELHTLEPDQPYFVAFFLVGAYQEILGDMHNLFGDTHVVHVDVDTNGKPRLGHVVRGDRVQEVLSYVEYFETELIASLRRRIETAIDEDRLTFEESALLLERYEAGLASYTYLDRGPFTAPPDSKPNNHSK